MARASATLVLPAVLWLVVAWGWPLLMVFSMSVRNMNPTTFEFTGLTLSYFIDTLTDPFYLDAIFRSLKIAAIVTFLSMVIGYPTALHIARTTSPRMRAAYSMILLIPIMISLVVTGFAWMLILGPAGFLNQAILFLGLAAKPLELMNSEAGIIAVLTYSFGPYMIINTCTSIERIDPSVLRAAQLHGARPWQLFSKIVLPLSVPGLISGGLIVFSLSAAAFVTPYIIGGNRVKVVPLLIYNAAVTTFDWALAATLSVILLVLSVVLTFAVSRFAERRFAAWLSGT